MINVKAAKKNAFNQRNFNQSGSILIDALIASALILIVVQTSVTSISQIERMAKDFNVSDSSNKQINQIIESIRVGLESYQINYNYIADNTTSYVNDDLNDEYLPMAWDENIQALSSDCVNCKGRYGFTIQPFEKFRGLFLVTLKVTHKNWSGPKVYQLVVSAK